MHCNNSTVCIAIFYLRLVFRHFPEELLSVFHHIRPLMSIDVNALLGVMSRVSELAEPPADCGQGDRCAESLTWIELGQNLREEESTEFLRFDCTGPFSC